MVYVDVSTLTHRTNLALSNAVMKRLARKVSAILLLTGFVIGFTVPVQAARQARSVILFVPPVDPQPLVSNP